MGTKNFLFMRLKVSLFILIFVTAGCQGIKTREDRIKPNKPEVPAALSPTEPSAPVEPTPTPFVTHEEVPSSRVEVGETPKVAVVLGPGGLRSYAQIGVLQELVKAKIPIQAVGGIEMGALVAASFANKGQIFDVEWQMMKLKEDEILKKGIIGSAKATDLRSLNNFLQNIFSTSKAEDSKLNFVCPAWNLNNHQAYLMSRGSFTSMLPYCLSLYPLLKPYNQNIAGVGSLSALARHFKSKGINYLIYVSVLDDKNASVQGPIESEENVGWNIVAQSLEVQSASFNYVIKVPMAQFTITDFTKRREMLQKGQEAGKSAAAILVQQMGL